MLVGAQGCVTLAHHIQRHGGFGVVPRVKDAAVIPGDGTVFALKLKDAGDGTVKQAVMNLGAFGEVKRAHGYALPPWGALWKYITTLLPMRGSAIFSSIRVSHGRSTMSQARKR